ncbi:hypothetical protein [Tenacibaculum aiptasiae]|uniref:hypothetical protein n=1 Tax=Tenacibaculum aiptasiae TaxID=426481 RepID=UPI00232EFC97|nr:hypothetical protein [Tenacibaculum aiptasiae]
MELHESLTSMNSLSYSIISFGIFYGIKQAAFFYTLFEYLIRNEYLRLIPSLFFGYFISRAMLNISSNISEDKEWVIKSIALFDFLVLCVITDVLKQNNWISITNLLIFCAFVTYLGFWLNKVFVERVKEKQNEALQKHELADINQSIVEKSNEEALLNKSLAEKKQNLKNIEQEIAERSCPHCSELFTSKRARDAHKGRCKKKG